MSDSHLEAPSECVTVLFDHQDSIHQAAAAVGKHLGQTSHSARQCLIKAVETSGSDSAAADC